MKKILLLLFPLLVLVSQSCTNPGRKDTENTTEEKNENKGIDKRDSKFAIEAASGGMMEVQLGQMAVQKASDPDVKSFGQQMIDDHSKANEELKALAQKKNISLPTALIDKHQRRVNKLQDESGADFDRKYMDMMVDDHEDDIDDFKDAAEYVFDDDMKAWAAKTLPTLLHHLEMAKKIKDKVKNHKDSVNVMGNNPKPVPGTKTHKGKKY